MKTLETIFKATKQLHQEQRLQSKKKILIFIRDVTWHTIETLTWTINMSLEELYLRTGLCGAEIRGLVDIEIVAFPHYEHCRREFDAKVQEVKGLFTKRKLFRELPGVPSTLVTRAMEAIWSAVLRNETASLPDINTLIKSYQYIYESSKLISAEGKLM
jgi:hypothetical protein